MSKEIFQPENATRHIPNYLVGENELERIFDFLGDNAMLKANLMAGQPITADTVLDVYGGFNRRISDIAINRMHRYSGWCQRAVPLKFANGIEKRTWSTKIYKPTIAARRAPYGTTKFIQFTRTSGSWEFEGWTIGTTFELGELMSPEGEMHFVNQMDALDSDIALTVTVNAMGCILMAPLPALTREAVLGDPYDEVAQLMSIHATYFGCLHRREKAVYDLFNWISRQRQLGNSPDPAFAVLPQGAKAQIIYGGNFETEKWRRGEQAIANLNGESTLNTINGIDVYECDKIAPEAVDSEDRLYDPLVSEVQVGLWYLSAPKLDAYGKEPNVERERGFAYLRLTGGVTWQVQPFVDLVRNAIQFNPKTGELRTDELYDFANNAPDFLELMGYKPVDGPNSDEPLIEPLISFNGDVHNLKPVVCEVFGMMNNDFLPESFIKKYSKTTAKTIETVMGATATAQILRLVEIMQQSARTVLERGGELTEAGRWVQAQFDAVKTRGFTPVNQFGVDSIVVFPTEDTEDDYRFMSIPPGFSTYPHMRYLASLYRTQAFREWTRNDPEKMAVWSEIWHGVTSTEKFARLIISIFSDKTAQNLITNPNACPINLRVPANNSSADFYNSVTSIVMNGLYKVTPPLAIRSRETEAETTRIDFAQLLGSARLDKSEAAIKNAIKTDLMSVELRDDIENNKFDFRDKFQQKVERDPNHSGLGDLPRGQTWLNVLITTPVTPGGNDSIVDRLTSRNRDEREKAVLELNAFYSFATRMTTPLSSDDVSRIRTPTGRSGTRQRKQYLTTDGASEDQLKQVRERSHESRAGQYRKEVRDSKYIGNKNIITHLVVDSSAFDENSKIFKIATHRVIVGSTSKPARTAGSSHMASTIFGNMHLLGASPMRTEGGDHLPGDWEEPMQTYVDVETGKQIPVNEARANLPTALIEIAGNSRWFVSHMREALDDAMLSPIERAVRIYLLCTQVNANVLENMARSNVEVPLAYMACDPFISFDMAAALFLNDNIGVAEHDFSDVQLINDGESKRINVHASFNLGCGITKPHLVSIQEAVMFRKYNGGGSGQIIDSFTSDVRIGSDAAFDVKHPRNRIGDRFVVALGPCVTRGSIQSCIDVSGAVNANAVRGVGRLSSTAKERGEILTVPGLAFLSYKTGMYTLRPATCRTLDTFESLRTMREQTMNTLCCAGAQRDFANGVYSVPVCNGEGPLGEIRESCGAVLNGSIGLLNKASMYVGTTPA